MSGGVLARNVELDGHKVVKSSRAPTSLRAITWGLRIRTHTYEQGRQDHHLERGSTDMKASSPFTLPPCQSQPWEVTPRCGELRRGPDGVGDGGIAAVTCCRRDGMQAARRAFTRS